MPDSMFDHDWKSLIDLATKRADMEKQSEYDTRLFAGVVINAMTRAEVEYCIWEFEKLAVLMSDEDIVGVGAALMRRHMQVILYGDGTEMPIGLLHA